MRLFFAVTIPPEITGNIVTASRKISAHLLRWVAPENQHFTLRFLGEIEEGRVAELISAGREAALKHHPFLLNISGAGFFPDDKRPRVFWVGAGAGSEKLVALAEDLSPNPEDRPFLPHLTVARITPHPYPPTRGGRVPFPKLWKGGGGGEKRFQELGSWKTRDFGSFPVNEFSLMESLLLPAGAVYRKVHSFLLEALDGR